MGVLFLGVAGFPVGAFGGGVSPSPNQKTRGVYTMASSKTRVKPIRISNETADYFEGKPLNRMVESLSELMQEGKIEFDGEDLKAKSVYTSKNAENLVLSHEKELKEIESMARFFGLSTEEVLKGIFEGLNDGYLTVEGGKIVGVPEVDLTELEEAARERNMTVEVVIDRTIKNLRSGK